MIEVVFDYLNNNCGIFGKLLFYPQKSLILLLLKSGSLNFQLYLIIYTSHRNVDNNNSSFKENAINIGDIRIGSNCKVDNFAQEVTQFKMIYTDNM
jgi:hypothetical protein